MFFSVFQLTQCQLHAFESSYMDSKTKSAWATHLAKAKVYNSLVFSGSLDEEQSFDEFRRFYYVKMSIFRVPEEVRVPLLIYSLDDDARSFFLTDIACSGSSPTDHPRVPENVMETATLFGFMHFVISSTQGALLQYYCQTWTADRIAGAETAHSSSRGRSFFGKRVEDVGKTYQTPVGKWSGTLSR